MLLRHPVLSLVTFAYLAAVAWVTLGPQPLDEQGRGVLHAIIRLLGRFPATDWVTYDGVEFCANVAMFLPVGVLFVLLFGRGNWWLAVLIGIGLTVAIEFAQTFLHDRVTDPRDIVANTLGAIAGVLVALIITGPKARRIKAAAGARIGEQARG